MVKKFLAIAAALVLGCASVFASGDIEIGFLDETMDYDEFIETFGDVETASYCLDLDLEECTDVSVMQEFFEVMAENVSGLEDGTVVLVYDDDILYVYQWGSCESFAFFVD